MSLSRTISHVYRQFKYPFLVFILICIKLLYMHYSVVTDKGELTTFAYMENIGTTLIDTGFILFFPFLLINRKKYFYILSFILIDIFVLTNIWYSRNFHSYFPLSLCFEFNNLQGLTNNILASIRWKDIIIPITSIFALLLIYYKFNTYESFKNRRQIAFTFLGCSLVLTGCFFSLVFFKSSSLKEKFILPYAYNPMESTFRHGTFYYFFIQVWNSESQQYSKEKLKELEPLFFTSETTIPVVPSNKNIIIIIVESLLSFADELSFNGQAITPCLNQIKKENTYYNHHVTPQTQLGESSDGQFIYLTGLLPLKNSVTIINHLKNKFISLSSLLKEQNKIIESRMTIPTGPTFWRQDKICLNYQIDSLFTRNEYSKKHEMWLNDEQIFDLAKNKDINTTQPFLSVILTSSTHSPYNQTIDNHITFDFPSDYSNELKNYLINLHYTDKQIGNYILSLKENNLYNNSIIIIVSDHEAHDSYLNLPPTLKHITKEIPLYIINSPVKVTRASNDTIKQSDIFPTLLDLTGIHSSWRGVGQSLLLPDSLANSPHELLRREKAQEISEIIIHSDYFRFHHYNSSHIPE